MAGIGDIVRSIKPEFQSVLFVSSGCSICITTSISYLIGFIQPLGFPLTSNTISISVMMYKYIYLFHKCCANVINSVCHYLITHMSHATVFV